MRLYSRFISTIVLIFMVCTLETMAQARTTITATTSGTWQTNANWDTGTFPAFNQTNNTDDLVIDIAGATPGVITLNSTFFLKSGTTLRIRNQDTLIITGDATFSNGSAILVEPGAVLKILGNLENKNNSNNIVINGNLSVGGDYTGGNGSVVSGSGTTDVTGTINLAGSGSLTTIVLPVELISFEAIFNNDRVDVTWSTASEINNDYFVIERSKDGFEWQEVFRVSGASNSSNVINYFESDVKPFTGVSYYRLKQVDFNGNEEVFNVVPVENISGGMIAFNIFPNPTTQDNINLSFKGFENEEILVVVRDIQGKEYYSKVTIIEQENEIQLLSIDKILPSGVYLITASSINELYSQKVIIK